MQLYNHPSCWWPAATGPSVYVSWAFFRNFRFFCQDSISQSFVALTWLLSLIPHAPAISIFVLCSFFIWFPHPVVCNMYCARLLCFPSFRRLKSLRKRGRCRCEVKNFKEAKIYSSTPLGSPSVISLYNSNYRSGSQSDPSGNSQLRTPLSFCVYSYGAMSLQLA